MPISIMERLARLQEEIGSKDPHADEVYELAVAFYQEADLNGDLLIDSKDFICTPHQIQTYESFDCFKEHEKIFLKDIGLEPNIIYGPFKSSELFSVNLDRTDISEKIDKRSYIVRTVQGRYVFTEQYNELRPLQKAKVYKA